MLRVLVLLLVVGLSAWAQDVEQFTLTDGRKFVGTYDAASEMLTAQAGGGTMRFAVEKHQIAERRPYVAPATSPPPAETVSRPVDTPPAQSSDFFAISPETVAKETAALEAAAAKSIAASSDAGEQNMSFYAAANALNPMTTTMLRARLPTDEPVRYRFIAELADPIPYQLEAQARSQWVLEINDGTGKPFGHLLIPRASDVGRQFESALTTHSLVAAHGWLRRKNSEQGVFVSPKMIHVQGWGFGAP